MSCKVRNIYFDIGDTFYHHPRFSPKDFSPKGIFCSECFKEELKKQDEIVLSEPILTRFEILDL